MKLTLLLLALSFGANAAVTDIEPSARIHARIQMWLLPATNSFSTWIDRDGRLHVDGLAVMPLESQLPSEAEAEARVELRKETQVIRAAKEVLSATSNLAVRIQTGVVVTAWSGAQRAEVTDIKNALVDITQTLQHLARMLARREEKQSGTE